MITASFTFEPLDLLKLKVSNHVKVREDGSHWVSYNDPHGYVSVPLTAHDARLIANHFGTLAMVIDNRERDATMSPLEAAS
jgi:hypothetical protein